MKSPGRHLNVCIAVEDIVGPIRNGGIGTTYTHLAFLLAEDGHEVTVLYLRGEHCENGTIEEWVSWYREKGVRFLPVELPEEIVSPAQRWIQPMYALYQHLRKETYDLVHVSEWRGSAYLSLIAKKQGLAFSKTVFCVKSSSPWLWNREVQLAQITQTSDLVKMYAERRSIELADLVIGGSSYLLRWMLAHGYHLPPGRTFVQPNVLKPVDIPAALLANRPARGSRVPVLEIVFFGRLEHRKGLDIFCEAINRLLADGVTLPPVTFMGKFGARIPTHPHLTAKEFIDEQTKDWPMPWQVHDNFQQMEALTYLHGDGRLAVIASIIENSPLTVYETTHLGIPFIASDVGGTSELVAEEHRKDVLTEPHPFFLGQKIKEAVEKGGLVAAPSFDNDQNLDQWGHFHNELSVILETEGWPPADLNTADETFSGNREELPDRPGTSICMVLKDDAELLDPVVSFLLQEVPGDWELLVVDDGSVCQRSREWLESLGRLSRQSKKQVRILRCAALGREAAWNFAAEQAINDYLCFVDCNIRLRRDVFVVLASVATHRQADILLPLYSCPEQRDKGKIRIEDQKTVVFLSGDPGFSFFDPTWRSPVVYVRRKAFNELGGFTTDYNVAGAVEELISKAVLSNKLVETVPVVLADQISDAGEGANSDTPAVMTRTVRPYTAAIPLCYQPLLWAARGLDRQTQSLQKQKEILKDRLTARIEQRDNLKKKLELKTAQIDHLKEQLETRKKEQVVLKKKLSVQHSPGAERATPVPRKKQMKGAKSGRVMTQIRRFIKSITR